MRKILTFLIFAILLSACAVTGATEAPTAAPQFEISDPAKSLEAAAAHITLGYYPPSNGPVEPQQTVTFTVTVK